MKDIRWILKFDTGADGFKRAIYILAALAALVLLWGFYYIFWLVRI